MDGLSWIQRFLRVRILRCSTPLARWNVQESDLLKRWQHCSLVQDSNVCVASKQFPTTFIRVNERIIKCCNGKMCERWNRSSFCVLVLSLRFSERFPFLRTADNSFILLQTWFLLHTNGSNFNAILHFSTLTGAAKMLCWKLATFRVLHVGCTLNGVATNECFAVFYCVLPPSCAPPDCATAARPFARRQLKLFVIIRQFPFISPATDSLADFFDCGRTNREVGEHTSWNVAEMLTTYFGIWRLCLCLFRNRVLPFFCECECEWRKVLK